MRTAIFLTCIGIAALILILLLAIPLVIFFELLANVKNQSESLSLPDFLSAAMWTQALIAWLTLIVVTTATVQIFFMSRQTRLQREQAEREAYRALINPAVISAKRLLTVPKIIEIFTQTEAMRNSLAESSENEQNAAPFQRLLDEAREKIWEVSKAMPWPLMQGAFPSLDHIEMLLNEYNYLSKLLLDKKLQRNFATDLTMANFQTIYTRLSPFIRLRRHLSPQYASHFIQYCEELRKKI